jgi:transcriptional regulator with XRE-family HTH domain
VRSLGRMLRDRMDELGIVHGREAALACGVNKDTINGLISGRLRGVPREDTLRRISAWTKVPIQDVREAAGRPRGEAEPFVPPDFFHELSQAERDAVVAMGRAFHDRHPVCEPVRDDIDPVVPESNGGATPSV